MIKKESLIREKIDTIKDALEKACGTDEAVDISSYYRALTTDIIASFAFGKDMDLLHDLGKAERLYATWRAQWKRMARFESHGIRYSILPWVEWVMSFLPSRKSSKEELDGIRSWLDYQEVRCKFCILLRLTYRVF